MNNELRGIHKFFMYGSKISPPEPTVHTSETHGYCKGYVLGVHQEVGYEGNGFVGLT
jgi:hypothetical protein